MHALHLCCSCMVSLAIAGDALLDAAAVILMEDSATIVAPDAVLDEVKLVVEEATRNDYYICGSGTTRSTREAAYVTGSVSRRGSSAGSSTSGSDLREDVIVLTAALEEDPSDDLGANDRSLELRVSAVVVTEPKHARFYWGLHLLQDKSSREVFRDATCVFETESGGPVATSAAVVTTNGAMCTDKTYQQAWPTTFACKFSPSSSATTAALVADGLVVSIRGGTRGDLDVTIPLCAHVVVKRDLVSCIAEPLYGSRSPIDATARAKWLLPNVFYHRRAGVERHYAYVRAKHSELAALRAESAAEDEGIEYIAWPDFLDVAEYHYDWSRKDEVGCVLVEPIGCRGWACSAPRSCAALQAVAATVCYGACSLSHPSSSLSSRRYAPLGSYKSSASNYLRKSRQTTEYFDQILAEHHCLHGRRHRYNTQWMLFHDVDEFVSVETTREEVDTTPFALLNAIRKVAHASPTTQAVSLASAEYCGYPIVSRGEESDDGFCYQVLATVKRKPTAGEPKFLVKSSWGDELGVSVPCTWDASADGPLYRPKKSRTRFQIHHMKHRCGGSVVSGTLLAYRDGEDGVIAQLRKAVSPKIIFPICDADDV